MVALRNGLVQLTVDKVRSANVSDVVRYAVTCTSSRFGKHSRVLESLFTVSEEYFFLFVIETKIFIFLLIYVVRLFCFLYPYTRPSGTSG